MNPFSRLARGIAMAATITVAGGSPALAASYVYVSNAEDGDIGVYAAKPDGTLTPAARVPAAKVVMPMTVSPDKRFLYAASRSKPYAVHAYAIDRGTGALKPVASSPLAESFPYISLDRTGRFLFGASYGGNLVSVNAIAGNRSVVSGPLQVIPTARNAHAIRVDNSNRFVYVPHLGTDQVFQFVFDEKTERLVSNTPPLLQMKAGTGPRHLVVSSDNRFVYLLSELVATVTTLALDDKTGVLSEVSVASMLPSDSKLQPGAPRPSSRNTDNDIWAADLHLTPDGKFLYACERTSSTLTWFGVDGASGRLSYLGSTPTERQPRGFAIDPKGKFLVASGEKSDTISAYAIDASSGALRLVGKYPAGKGANWVEIVEFD